MAKNQVSEQADQAEQADRVEPEADHDAESLRGKLRQILHAASGDREAEAKALADRAGADVSEEDALIAVERAHGERRDEPAEGVELATVKDARVAAGVDDRDVVTDD